MFELIDKGGGGGYSQFVPYGSCLTLPMRHTKMHFSAKCNSGFIAIQWFHIKHYFDYQYTKIQPLGCKKFAFLHDNRLRFPDYYYMVATLGFQNVELALAFYWNT